jgi:ankyrin repeat protein
MRDLSFRLLSIALVLLSVAAGMRAAENDRRLIDAAKQGNKASIRALLKEKVPVNTVASDGTTALHWAVRSDDLETAKLLLQAGANVRVADRYGIAPLKLAAENGSAAMIEILLKAGADPNTTLPSGETTLMTAAHTGKPDAISMLLTHGAKPNERESRFGETAMMWAAAENNGAAIRVLADGGGDLNAKSNLTEFPEFKFLTSGMVITALPKGGWTPLMYAARQGSMDSARTLIEAGANPNLTDPDGTTATIIAIINAHFDLAAMLAEKGVDLNVADSSGMTALYAAVDMHTLAPMLSRPAPKVTDKLDAAALVPVLLKHGANPNLRLKKPIIGRHHDSGDASMGEGTTPLMRAAKSADFTVIRSLLEGGANPALTQKDYSNMTMILMNGRGAGNESAILETIKLCVEHGLDFDAFNANGQTLLHIAVQRGNNSIVRYLAENGAKLDMKNKQGRTPLDLALGVGAAPGGPVGPPGGGGARGARGGAGGGGGSNLAAATILREFLR